MRDKVTHEVAMAVFNRDRGCVALLLGGWSSQCWGTIGLEHVQDGGGRMGRRAPSDVRHLVSLCQGHREPGMMGGHVWCTDKVNRQAMREYLKGVNA